MTAAFTNSAFGWVPPLPLQYTGDPLQLVNAAVGYFGTVSNWTLRVANALNAILPSGAIPIPVSAGGTGRVTLTTHAVLLGEGAAAVGFAGPGATSGVPLIAQGAGADPVFGTALVVGGGTGTTSFTAHGVLIGEGTAAFGVTSVGGSGIPLIGQAGADPVFGTALVGGGGTGLTSGTSGGIPFFSSTTTMASSALLATNAVVLGGGAATTPFTDAAWTIGQTNHPLIGLAPGQTDPGAVVLNGVRVIAADGNSAGLQLNQAAAQALILGVRANNTLASPNALALNDVILAVAGRGYAATGYSSANRNTIQLRANQAWTDTAQGSSIVLSVTANGTTTPQLEVATFLAPADGGTKLGGTTAGDSAAAGFVGEYLSTIVLIANEVNINAAANVCTLSLTAGDWDVSGELWVDNQTGASTSNGNVGACITTTSATLSTVPADTTARARDDFLLNLVNTIAVVLPVGPTRISLTTTTNVFLVGVAAVTAGNNFGYGKLRARRVR